GVDQRWPVVLEQRRRELAGFRGAPAADLLRPFCLKRSDTGRGGMGNISAKRGLLGGVVGGVVFSVIDCAFQFGLLMHRYQALQERGIFYKQPRIPFFVGAWFVILFLSSIAGTWFYAAARDKLGPGAKTAVIIGLILGLLMGLPT